MIYSIIAFVGKHYSIIHEQLKSVETIKFSGRHKYPHDKARRVDGQYTKTVVVVSCKQHGELYVNSWNFGAF